MGAPCTCLCSTNSEISSGTIWNYRIFHNTAKNVKEPPLFPPSYDFSLFPKLWSLHSEDFHVVSLLCSRQADFSHKCRSVLMRALFSFYFVIIFRALVGALYSIQRSGNIFLTKTNLRSVKVCRSYEHKEAGMQTALQSHMKHLLTSTHGSSTGNYIIISLYKALSFNSPSDPRSRK